MDIDFYLFGKMFKKRDEFFYKFYQFKILYEQTKLHH
jgi:hypothetical protein